MKITIFDIIKVILLYTSTIFLANGIVTDDINMERTFAYITLGILLFIITPAIIKASVEENNIWVCFLPLCFIAIPLYITLYSMFYYITPHYMSATIFGFLGYIIAVFLVWEFTRKKE